jgi:hypothetical protein
MGKTASIHTKCKEYVKNYIRKTGKGNLSMGLELLVDIAKTKNRPVQQITKGELEGSKESSNG